MAGRLNVPVHSGQAYATIDRLDGFEKVETDDTDMQHHRAQLPAKLRGRAVGERRMRRDGLAGLERSPTDEELMAAARAL